MESDIMNIIKKITTGLCLISCSALSVFAADEDLSQQSTIIEKSVSGVTNTDVIDTKALTKQTEANSTEPVENPLKNYEKSKEDIFNFGQFENKESNSESETGDAVIRETGIISIWKLSISSLFVLSLLIGFLFLLKKFGAKYAGIKTDDIIRITSRVQVDSKNTLMMLRVYEDEMLVGVGQNGIQLLSRFNQIDNEDDLISDEKTNQNKQAFEKAFSKGIEIEDIT